VSIKWQNIVDALETRLKTISTDIGYHNDVDNIVYTWRSAPFQTAEMPGINIRDLNDDVVEEYLGNPNLTYHRLTIEIDLACTTSAIARSMIADTCKAINTDRTLSGYCIDIEYDGAEILTNEQNENVITGARVTVGVIYQTEKFEEE